ncbi:YT521-B-like domain-containing protein [Mycena capillaripes]|nr:YT521-B-like domain-containing protein [Mycena capillaripes]
MVSPTATIPTITDPPPYEGTLTPRPSIQQLNRLEDRLDRTGESQRVYAFTPTPGEKESSLKAHSGGGEDYMPAHGRGGSDQARSGGSSNRRQGSQASQPRRQPPGTPGYPSLNDPAEVPQGYPPPLSTASAPYPPPRAGYPGQYMIPPQPPLNMAHTPPTPFSYSPFAEQPQSIHAGYPTIATYPPYTSDRPPYTSPQPPGAPSPQQPSPGFPPSYPYPSPSLPPTPRTRLSPLLFRSGRQQCTRTSSTSIPLLAPTRSTTTLPVQYEAGPSTYAIYPPPQHPGDNEYHSGSHPASPTYARASTPSSSGAPSPVQSGRDKPIVRRSYHPNPPAHRSEWVMWAGNVPSDAVHDELWRFFTQPLDEGGSGASSSSSSSVDAIDSASALSSASRNGVLSIFLISRSSCAFVNYETHADLDVAIKRFNGVPLRADPRCQPLVCRARRKDDDLRAGVGGQRGMGMHSRWVKSKAEKTRDDSASVSSASASDSGSGSHLLEPSFSALSIGSEDDIPTRPPPRPHAGGSNSSGSHASTNSSLLRQHFPQRFFILKSLTRDDLDLSVQTGVWATQKHNEGILDRAFRTSKDVFLIFSVNKSGEFYGYARMAGPVGQGDGGRVPWSRRDSTASTGSARVMQNQPAPPHGAGLLSTDRLVDDSPALMSTPTSASEHELHSLSAPAELGEPHRALSLEQAAAKGSSLDLGMPVSARRQTTMVLDETAPFRMARTDTNLPGEGHERTGSMASASAAPLLGSVAEESGEREEATTAEGGATGREEGWGQDFKLQWLCTDRLPFTRTRHIRNPWNHDREVKVSRDGTELEPPVGHALLEEWRLYAAEGGVGPQTPMVDAGGRSSRAGGGGGGGRGGTVSRS